MAQIEAQCQQLAEEETLHHELQLIVGRLAEFAAQVTQNLEELEWSRQRDIIRALVRRVEIALDRVQVVFRVDAFAGETDPEKKACNFVRGVTTLPWGTPVSVGFQHSPSITPARSPFRTNWSTRPSLLSSAIKSMSFSWSMVWLVRPGLGTGAPRLVPDPPRRTRRADFPHRAPQVALAAPPTQTVGWRVSA
jgi:hypothetical protein